ncbi:hypothetical protein FQA47_023069 [Oryzias melastigma]|uniref:Secreted protein n=1 Tax=Oryzias melastigma TaxID=30732 RepID=A0A834F8V6_ORYME|nr:hypothetical protein FQA47_023069 [Oryzias melastigma]
MPYPFMDLAVLMLQCLLASLTESKNSRQMREMRQRQGWKRMTYTSKIPSEMRTQAGLRQLSISSPEWESLNGSASAAACCCSPCLSATLPCALANDCTRNGIGIWEWEVGPERARREMRAHTVRSAADGSRSPIIGLFKESCM